MLFTIHEDTIVSTPVSLITVRPQRLHPNQPFRFEMLFSGAEKDKEVHELKRAVDVMLALKDFEEKCSPPSRPPQ